jgi:hypothetical protein
MKRSDTRPSRPRWRTLASATLAIAVVAVIGVTSMAPAKADWRRDGWHGRPAVGFGFSFGAPAYGYYPYPAYPAYGYYPYYGGYYPYYYGGPSVSFDFGHR